jgi:hypothetical protein
MVSRWFHSNLLCLQCRVIFLWNTCCRYSMLNRIIDSRKVRAQKATQSSQSSESTFVPRRSEEQLKIEMLKDALRQWDDYYAQALAQRQVMLQISWAISFTIKHLVKLLKLIHCITICITNSAAARIWRATVPTPPPLPQFSSPFGAQVHFVSFEFLRFMSLDLFWCSSNDLGSTYSVVRSFTIEWAPRHTER